MDASIGLTLPDLTHKFNFTTEEYSRSLSMRGVSFLLSLPIGSVILDHAFHHIELAFSVSILIFGVCVALVPWSGSLVVLGLLYGIQGILYGLMHMSKYF